MHTQENKALLTHCCNSVLRGGAFMMILHLIQLNYCVAKYIRFFFLLEETSSVRGEMPPQGNL